MQEIRETQAHNDKNNPPKALIAGSSNNAMASASNFELEGAWVQVLIPRALQF